MTAAFAGLSAPGSASHRTRARRPKTTAQKFRPCSRRPRRPGVPTRSSISPQGRPGWPASGWGWPSRSVRRCAGSSAARLGTGTCCSFPTSTAPRSARRSAPVRLGRKSSGGRSSVPLRHSCSAPRSSPRCWSGCGCPRSPCTLVATRRRARPPLASWRARSGVPCRTPRTAG